MDLIDDEGGSAQPSTELASDPSTNLLQRLDKHNFKPYEEVNDEYNIDKWGNKI